MNSRDLIDALMEIKIQAEMIPVFDHAYKSKKEWLVNNQRHWVIRKLNALIAAAVVQQEEGDEP